MLIIDSTSTQAIQYNPRSTRIRMINEDNLYKLMINDVEYAKSESYQTIQVLYTRLMSYCERYRRKDDTFDIVRELKIIDKEIAKGKYNYLSINASNLSMCIGYPTYTS